MRDDEALGIAEKIFRNVFGKGCDLSMNELLGKFAFDVKLPKKVRDTITGETTWADSVNSGKYMSSQNAAKRDADLGWMLPKKNVSSLRELIDIWNVVNFTTTERVFDSMYVAKSDTIYRCENVYHSTSCSDSKNVVYCDSCMNCEYILASQRSGTCNFCIRCDDSSDCCDSYNVSCSGKTNNSLFVQDCYDLYECIFCAHIVSKRFCIANMQFEETEYFEIKKKIIEWILAG